MLKKYRISRRSTDEIIVVRAAVIVEAAHIAVRRIYPRSGLIARRTTGNGSFSGWFQPYRYDGDSRWSSEGEPFHVTEV